MIPEEPDTRRPLWVDIILLGLALVIFLALFALGNWQVRRLEWKQDLIEAVDARAFGTPVAAPRGPVTFDEHVYLRVTTTGTYRHDLSLRIKAVTEIGPGSWVMTPLETPDQTFWINRGFIPDGRDVEILRPRGEQVVTGLLRMTEPEGTLLERNQPEAGRGGSRDVAAMTLAAGLVSSAPYFVDAEASGVVGEYPRGGLTVVEFNNKHLSYAITWYAMALFFLGAMAYVIWERIRGPGRGEHPEPS